MDTTKAITHVGLCAGYGGIELGISRAIPNLRSVALCEIEAFPIANLVAKMEAGLMDAVPIWTDLKTFPWEEFRGRVDILTGGYPCQPFSAAGKRLGKEDPRHLWPFIADGIAAMRPSICFFENVEGHISMGLSDVIEDLAGMGYRTTWGIFSAREVGAPHQRKRVFILAYDTSIGIQGCGADWLQESRPHAGQGLPLRGGDAKCGELADTQLHGRHHTDERSDADGIQGPLGQGNEHWKVVGNGQLWPSRPGQPQHGWEPPRVVGDTKERGCAKSGPYELQAGIDATPWDSSGKTGEVLGNATSQRLANRGAVGDVEPQGIAPEVQGGEPAFTIEQPDPACGTMANTQSSMSGVETEWEWREGVGGGGEEILGNPESRTRLWRSPWDSRHPAQPDQGVGNTKMLNGTGQTGRLWKTQTRRTGPTPDNGKAQPALGRDADGPSGGMDYAELCISYDNRTDELRLLGNGVVPATAERAFRTLLNELLT